MKQKMSVFSHKQPTRLKNRRCAYCNADFDQPNEPQKEHVIGKLFVPKRSHEQQWNLHVNSCHNCNQRKSALENDISAICMAQMPGGHDEPDEKLSEEFARRAEKTFSRRTRRTVGDSFEKMNITGSLGPAKLTFGFIGPPQVDADRMFQLALFQLQGFHFFLTYDQSKQQGWHWPGVYCPISAVRAQDWGNPLKMAFSDLSANWLLRLNAPTASGYFHALIKKHPDATVWSWALEWNKTFRVYGLYGMEQEIDEISKPLRTILSETETKPASNERRYRQEVPLEAENDRFFDFHVDN